MHTNSAYPHILSIQRQYKHNHLQQTTTKKVSLFQLIKNTKLSFPGGREQEELLGHFITQARPSLTENSANCTQKNYLYCLQVP